MIEIDWETPFSLWLVSIADAELRTQWWGEVANRSEQLIEWLVLPAASVKMRLLRSMLSLCRSLMQAH